VIRRQVIAAPAFPPEQLTVAIRCAVEELLTVLLPKRRLRAFPRAVKRKMSNYQLKTCCPSRLAAAHDATRRGRRRPASRAQHKLPKPLTAWHWP
jgi:hypothetical protein